MKSKLLILFMLCISVLGIAAETQDSAEDLYIEGLELLLEERTDRAVNQFEQLVNEYPDSEYADRAQDRLEDLRNRRDTSGLVGFYTGNLLTAAYVTAGIPIVLELGNVATGVAGIAGIGGSLYLSSVLTRDQDISLGTQLWTDSIQATSVLSYVWIYNMLNDTGVIGNSPDSLVDDTDSKIIWLGTMATAVTSRAIGYSIWRNQLPPAGKPAAYLTAYAWSNIYLALAFNGVFMVDNPLVTGLSHLGVSTSAALFGAHMWESAGWSSSRIGMLTIGGAGGMLIGGFVSTILSPLNLSSELNFANLMVFGALGQITAGLTTGGFDPDPRWEDVSMQITPTIRTAGVSGQSTGKSSDLFQSNITPGIEVTIRY